MTLVSVLSEIVKHLPNEHDQQAHAGLGEKVGREAVLRKIMEANPPIQVSSGKMSTKEWADQYLSERDKEYVLAEVHPEALELGVGPGDEGKVAEFQSKKSEAPPVVVDSNEKLQARIGGGKLEQAYGLLPHVVIDGKHRVEAARRSGRQKILAYIPTQKLSEILKRSRAAERNHFAENYFSKKGWDVVSTDRASYWNVKKPDGSDRHYENRDLEKIAANTGHEFVYNED